MQTIIDATYAYGNAYDIVFNITKSQVMFYDTLKKADMEDNMRGLYARSNMLRRKFYFFWPGEESAIFCLL